MLDSTGERAMDPCVAVWVGLSMVMAGAPFLCRVARWRWCNVEHSFLDRFLILKAFCWKQECIGQMKKTDAKY